MKKAKCQNGHFFDLDRYSVCPLCKKPGTPLNPASSKPTPVQYAQKTEMLWSAANKGDASIKSRVEMQAFAEAWTPSEPISMESPAIEGPVFEKEFLAKSIPKALISEEPVSEKTISDERAPQESTFDELAPQESTFDEPAPQESTFDELAPQESTFDEPAPQESTFDEPVPEKTIFDEPVPEEPTFDEPTPKALICEEPVLEAPLPEELISEAPIPEELVHKALICEEPTPEAPAPEETIWEVSLPEGTAPKQSQRSAVSEQMDGSVAVKAPSIIPANGLGTFYEEQLPVAWLIGLNGPILGCAFACQMGRTRIGRSDRMDIVLSNVPSVSEEFHAAVIFEPIKKEFFLEAGIGNGLTYLNGNLVFSHDTLQPYDKIRLGKVEFVFLPLCGDHFSWDDYI